MKKLHKIENFDAFILNEGCTQRQSAIATAVSKIKEKYGHTSDKFLQSAKEKGVEEITDFIRKTVEPYMDRIESQEKLQTKGRPTLDYDALLEGCVSWIIVELQVQRMKKDTSK